MGWMLWCGPLISLACLFTVFMEFYPQFEDFGISKSGLKYVVVVRWWFFLSLCYYELLFVFG
jgi:hypothetical protein